MGRTVRIAVIGGDGIGPEVIAEAVKVLKATASDTPIETSRYDLGAARYVRTGEILPGSVLAEIAEHDAILLGAVGDPSVPSGALERGLGLRLRFEFDQYVNKRPVRLFPGVDSPLAGLRTSALDMLVVREGTEERTQAICGCARSTPWRPSSQISALTTATWTRP